MATIHNPTTTIFHLPGIAERDPKTGAKTISHASPGMLAPGKVVDVPDGYFKAITAHKSWTNRLDVKGKGARVRMPGGVAGAFARRVLDKRRTAAAAADPVASRLSALEAEAVAAKG